MQQDIGKVSSFKKKNIAELCSLQLTNITFTFLIFLSLSVVGLVTAGKIMVTVLFL
jgi:hypothetical protein